MHVKASLNNLRIAPRKTRLIADLIRGLGVKEAHIQLRFLVKKTALPMGKLLDSAMANARHNFKLNPDDLYISELYVNEGPVLKRGRSRARGRVFPIRKKTSHIHLILSEKKDKQRSALNAAKAKTARAQLSRAEGGEEISAKTRAMTQPKEAQKTKSVSSPVREAKRLT